MKMKKLFHSIIGGKHSAFCILHSAFLRAFTLVELMVVLAVMGILVMILLPTLRNAREHARSTACQNNLRQYGIAMGRYMSDWKGYFIYPGEGGSYAMYKAKDVDVSTYPAGIGASAGGVAGSAYQLWTTFVSGYLPKILPTNYAYMIANVSSVQMCPSVQQELKSGNFFDTKSPSFKGYSRQVVCNEDCDVADFEDKYDDDDNLILASYFTTYAINNNSGVYGSDRTNISNRTVAFIDWNAMEGWQYVNPSGPDYTLYRPANTWQFKTPAGRTPPHSQNDPKWTTNWCLTEVGFHHKDGTNIYANYVAMDGSVASVTSNQINLSYFQSTGPR